MAPSEVSGSEHSDRGRGTFLGAEGAEDCRRAVAARGQPGEQGEDRIGRFVSMGGLC